MDRRQLPSSCHVPNCHLVAIRKMGSEGLAVWRKEECVRQLWDIKRTEGPRIGARRRCPFRKRQSTVLLAGGQLVYGDCRLFILRVRDNRQKLVVLGNSYWHEKRRGEGAHILARDEVLQSRR